WSPLHCGRRDRIPPLVRCRSAVCVPSDNLWLSARDATEPAASPAARWGSSPHMRARRVVAGTLVTGLCLATGGTAVAVEQHSSATGGLDRVKHIVVIYEENHSFDNLYGGWEGVNGLANADPAHTTQVNQEGEPFTCLLQNDVNLTSPDPLPATCTDTTTATPFVSHFANSPFRIDDYIKPSDTTCPAPGASVPNGVRNGTGDPGGCTRDLVHRFYNEQYQLDG